MPLDLAPADRKLMLYFAIGIGVLVLAIVVFTPREEPDPGFPSSYSPHSHGAEAAFLLLKESGYPVERWIQSPLDLPQPGAGTLLILANPIMPPEAGEREAMAQFLATGGRVLAIGPGAEHLLGRSDLRMLKVPQIEWHEVPPSLPSGLSRGGAIKTDEYWKWKPDDVSVLVHYASADGPLVISYPQAKGEVIWWTNSTPITNAAIHQAGNLELLLNSVGPAPDRILWDEFYHNSRKGLWARVSGTPLKWLLWQMAAFSLALLFTYSRRSGPLQALVTPSRLSPLEFVETLGGLYKRARASGFAVEVAGGRFRQMLTRRLGLQRDLGAEALARAARDRLGAKDPDVQRTLEECAEAEHDPELDDRTALRLVRELNDHARALKLIPGHARPAAEAGEPKQQEKP